MSISSLRVPAMTGQRWFLAGLSVFFLVVTCNYYFKVHADERETRSAFKRWRGQILEIDQGENIWAKHIYPNPPIMALILKPLADLPPLWGSLGWFVMKVIMTILAVQWIFSALERDDQTFPLWAKAVVVLLALRPIQGDLMHGNVNLFIMFLVVGALCAYSRGADIVGGMVLALSIACKVTPALFLPYFVWKRAWKLLAASAVGLVVFIWIVPGLWLGFDKNKQGLTSWYENMIVPFMIKGEVTPEHQNQSLPGLSVRLFSSEPSFATFVENEYTPVEYHNIADVNPVVIRWAIKGVMLVFCLLIVWSCRTSPRDRSDWRLWAEFSLIALGMLLFSERTWKHHCVMLLLPFATLGYALAVRWHDRTLRNWLIGSAALAISLMTATSTGISDAHDRFGKMAQVYGAYVWSYVVLMAAMILILRRCRDDSATRMCTRE